MWDEDVDVVCTGSGVAGWRVPSLQSIWAVRSTSPIRAVITPARTWARSVHGVTVCIPWLGVDVGDSETNDYFAALSPTSGR
jgi:hypothetical protein